jgi:ubiquinone/menaquinone biosynthesis C-methylase UbiE
MSTKNIYIAVLENLRKQPLKRGINYLDIGAGSGELIEMIKSEFDVRDCRACDYTDKLMRIPGQQVDIVNLNREVLPYHDSSLDLVTATEVIEHLENPRHFLREISRMLKPRGLCVLSTPNVLNLNSRLRYLWFGFPVLFGPLPLGNRILESCAGHISPLSYFYLRHALHEAGFIEVTLGVERFQRSGLAKLVLLAGPLMFFAFLIRRREIAKYRTIDESNRSIVEQMNSLKVLLGRTLIISAFKSGRSVRL